MVLHSKRNNAPTNSFFKGCGFREAVDRSYGLFLGMLVQSTLTLMDRIDAEKNKQRILLGMERTILRAVSSSPKQALQRTGHPNLHGLVGRDRRGF